MIEGLALPKEHNTCPNPEFFRRIRFRALSGPSDLWAFQMMCNNPDGSENHIDCNFHSIEELAAALPTLVKQISKS